MEPIPTTLTRLKVPTAKNKLLEQVLELINENEEILALWKVINVNAMERIGFSDHGIVHFQVVSNIGLKLTRMLLKAGVEMSITKNFQLSSDYAELVVFLACVLHDLGMSINRDQHEEFSLIIANNILRDLLSFMNIGERTIVISETLHAIISHRAGGKPVTLEAGIVRVADALDMTKGRARIAFESGNIGIHSLSAAAIDKVEISEGTAKPIHIDILMNNSAGLFQVDELLKEKLAGSGLEMYMEITAHIDSESEKKLLQTFDISL